jgi:hypothetical protein
MVTPARLMHEISYYAGLMRGVYELIKQPPVRDPKQEYRASYAAREDNFLSLVRNTVFGGSPNPYREMMDLAGCGYGDLESALRREGLEPTLKRLSGNGVLLTHDEFKGKVEIVRSGRHIVSNKRSFLNPLVRGHMETSSGGSRSLGTGTRQTTRQQVYWDICWKLLEEELGLPGRARVQLQPILPSSAGITAALQYARYGTEISRWFAMPGAMWDYGHYRVATQAVIVLARMLGARMPSVHYLPPDDFAPVARWVADLRAKGQPSVVTSYASHAVRVTAAASAMGLDIRGTLFLVSGEALTQSKRSTIEAAGAEVYPFYWITELGPIGYSCRQMRSGNCVHVLPDSVAVVDRRRRAPLSETELDSLLFTSLLPFAPRLLINVEMDDTGVIEPAGCDCLFSRLGMTTQIRDIASYGKLTGQGVTLCGTDVVEILEKVLPAKFGGAPGDYQLVESDSARQTQLVLRVSSRVGGGISLDAVQGFFLGEIRRRYGGALAVTVWRHAEGMKAVAAEPLVTPAGKVLPLHLLGQGGEDPTGRIGKVDPD